jgi:hypothetical protein
MRPLRRILASVARASRCDVSDRVAARPFWQHAMVDENHQLPCARPDGGKLTSPGAERAGKSPKEEPP